MRCVSRKILSISVFLAAGYLTPVTKAQQPASATVFEGARLITGDGSAPVANSAFVVENGRFTAVGQKGQVKAPAGAAHVDLTGKTVMPAIIDAHKHLAVTRDALVDQLQHFAYYGIGATMSLGQDTGDEVYQVRAETIPNAARYRTAGRGITGREPGRSQAPFWVTSEPEVRKDVDDEYIKRVKAKPNFIVAPNLPDRGVKADRSWLRDSMTAAEFQKVQADTKDDPKAQQFFGIQCRNLARLNKEGIKISLGSDGPIPWAAHEEMADMAGCGMTPAQGIVAATRDAAELMERIDAGTIAVRRSADFVVLDANPLDDITNTRRISSVYLRGSQVDRAGLRARWTSGRTSQ